MVLTCVCSSPDSNPATKNTTTCLRQNPEYDYPSPSEPFVDINPITIGIRNIIYPQILGLFINNNCFLFVSIGQSSSILSGHSPGLPPARGDLPGWQVPSAAGKVSHTTNNGVTVCLNNCYCIILGRASLERCE